MRRITWKDVAREWAGILVTLGVGGIFCLYVALTLFMYASGGY